MRKQRTADAAANVARFDEQLVQVQRTWRIAGRERDDAGNLPVGPGRDPHIAGSDVLSGDPPRAAGISAMNSLPLSDLHTAAGRERGRRSSRPSVSSREREQF